MRNLLYFAAVLGLVVGLTAGPVAAGNSPADAEAMVKKAIDFYKANGKEKTVAAMNDPNGEFKQGELYAFMFDFDVNCMAHPANPKLVGKNLSDLKDAEGKQFMQEMAAKAKAGGGWTDYKWSNPETKKLQDKSSYALPVSGESIFIGCGIYK
jgi:cytochrome c